MTDSLADRETRGHRAQSLRDHPAFIEATAAVREKIHEQFATAKSPEIAWDARQRLRALSDIETWLGATITDGKNAQAEEGARSPAEAIVSGEVAAFDKSLADYAERAAAARARHDPQPEETPDGGSTADAP